ncbi:MAG: hypothetical protein HYS26_01035 [Candidatus Kaiserbacteria bacterium]|nr:MAG: hypothetical protein HYS26_01035 [Candidatus Kaiserbacteria bacterium]
MHTHRTSFTALAIFSVGIALALAIAAFATPRAGAVGESAPLEGYAWSDTIGWISFDCAGPDECDQGDYQIMIASDGALTGYAWSDSIGWISANPADLSGCPSAPCEALLDDGELTGWLKALSAADGWDGWISLSGSGYGVTESNGTFDGYAWGSDVVGWVDFSYAHTTLTCEPTYSCSGQNIVNSCTGATTACVSPAYCSAGSAVCLYPPMDFEEFGDFSGHLQIVPGIVRSGDTTRVYWNVENADNCTVTGSNGDSWSGNFSGTSGQATSPILQSTTYTLQCTAPDGSVPASLSEDVNVIIVPVFCEVGAPGCDINPSQ